MGSIVIMNVGTPCFNLDHLRQLMFQKKFCTREEGQELSDMINSENISPDCSICFKAVFGSHSVTLVHAKAIAQSTGESTLVLHLFHDKCLKTWQVHEGSDRKRCPLCRREALPRVSFSSVAAAVESGKKKGVQSLIADGADPDAPHSWNAVTALHIAVKKGNLDLALELISMGANINCQDDWGNTAVHHAIYSNNPQMLATLLTCKPDINIRNRGCQTPLHEAAEHPEEPDLFNYLLFVGADYDLMNGNGCRAIHCAAQSGHITALRALINKGVDVNVQDYDQCTALHYTTKPSLSGHCDFTKDNRDKPGMVKLLIEAGARVDLRSDCGYTAFDGAECEPEVLKLLLPEGRKVFDVNQSLNGHGDDLLYFSLQANDLELFGKLIAEGANVENIGQHYWHRFFKEPCEQRRGFLDILNKSGYQLSGTDKYGWKVLVKTHEENHINQGQESGSGLS